MENIFGLLRPDMVDCMVTQYHWGRATLTVKLSRENSPDIQYLKFGGVEVFSGPLKWRGANFIQRPTSDCLELLQQAERVSEFVTEADLEERTIRLYVVELEHIHVQIVANMANRYSG
jgi:hypothetical protein